MSKKRIGIMGAMPEEIEGIAALLSDQQRVSRGRRIYYTGQINGIEVVLVFSRWGKVAAATTVTNLIVEFNITHLYFTGVAGGVNSNVRVGDIVVATRLIQHDMDARPLMPQYEIPLLGKTYFEVGAEELNRAVSAVNTALHSKQIHDALGLETLQAFGISEPKVLTGDIASGDKFVTAGSYRDELLAGLPDVLCVEMEGAAVAQVCYEYGIPFSIIRTISDSADEHAHFNFADFIKQVAGVYSLNIIRALFYAMAKHEGARS
ncbi:MAG TPA: 5'-methylthioadenosine/adenosylhomocysteine nucleosidase [Chitinophagales bacterium]|nr:5'-methylthioadenosine/adenosylhomocysteine nucleosidase [Chitinophagales bacterium]